MKTMMRAAMIGVMFTVAGLGAAGAADMPKVGNYDVTSCWGGTSNMIPFSKTHVALGYELAGTFRSNPPGGFMDMMTYRCVGTLSTIDGKTTGPFFCESIDNDGHKMFSRNMIDGTKTTQETLAGTGKYEGIVRTGGGESLGQFPTIKPGTFQGCNHQTGTYRLQ